MLGLRHHRRWAVWVASFAIAVNAFAPLLAQAWFQSQAGAASWLEVCSTSSFKADALKSSSTISSSDADQAPTKNSMKSAHCPFCLPHAGSFALLPSATPVVAALQQHDAHPELFYSAPRPLFAWTQSQPRAPPAAC